MTASETDYDDEYFDDEGCVCPKCGHETHARDCQSCDEFGQVVTCIDDMCRGQDYCIHGDGMSACPDCDGHMIERWCPGCGANYWHALKAKSEEGG
jgi:hypothetical protein